MDGGRSFRNQKRAENLETQGRIPALLVSIAEQFTPYGRVLEVREYGRGNVHDTYLVTRDWPDEKNFILQRLNTRVFRNPQRIMDNLGVVTEHVGQRLKGHPLAEGRRWEVPQVLLTREGKNLYHDSQGQVWRALRFIEAAQTYDTIQNPDHAREVGFALGRFHRLLSDLPGVRLAVTLEGFHVTPGYLRHFDKVISANPPAPGAAADYALDFIRQRRSWASVLIEAQAKGRLKERVIHGDPKVNNVLLDVVTGQAVGMIDLDTVQPGLVHYDIGDCLRSGCNPLGEETENPEAVYFDLHLCRAILQGYFTEARDFLTPADYAYIYAAVRLLAFELGLRFFTDFVAGNVYFRATNPEHNLRRALVQFRLTESIESQQAEIEAIVRDFI